MTDPFLHDFWEASALNELTITQFATKLEAYEAEAQEFRPDPLTGSQAPHALPQKNDRLQKTLQRRRSQRSFADRPLSEKELGQVLASLSGPMQQRLYPSAGGLGSVEVFALLHGVDCSLGRIATRYLADSHSLAPIPGELPDQNGLDQLLSLAGAKPALVLVFAVRFDELVRKYGPRGGRFALIEVGHACQNVALRLAADGLAGYQLGGTLDHELQQLLGLGVGPQAVAKVTLGYAIGHPA